MIVLMPFRPTQLVPYADRYEVASRYSQYPPYQYDSDPESYHQRFSSHVSRPLPTLALKLQDPRLSCDRNLGWSLDWAVAFLVDFLDPNHSPDAATGLRNIRVRAQALEKEGNALEIPFRIFNKLNEILFAGHLKNAVYLELRKLHPDVSGATYTHGWGLDPKVKRVSVYLNKDTFQQARSRDLIGALIHHMIHAYFLVACGPQVEKETAYGRLDHGAHFGKIMTTIRNLTGLHGRPLTSLDYGHTLNQRNHLFYDEYTYHQRKPYRHRSTRKEKWYCSHCPSDVPSLSNSEVEKWYTTTSKPLLTLPTPLRSSTVKIYNPLRHTLETVPRGETTPSPTSVEFIYKDNSTLVPLTHLDAFPSIRYAFEKAKCRYLELNEFISQDTILRFYELLHSGGSYYGPELKHMASVSPPGSRRKGPPVIKSPSTGEPYLLTDIRMYKMGAIISFDEVKAIALERMYRYGVTYEDPVGLLSELFGCGGEPDAEMKVWTRRFLGRGPEGDGGDGGVWGAPGVAAGREPSNLAKLECELLGWKGRFADLLEGSSALKYEAGRVRRELVAVGVYGLGSGVGMPMTALRGLVGPQLALGMGMGMRRGGYLGLPWVPETEVERRNAVSAASGRFPYSSGEMRYTNGYDEDEDVSSWGTW